MKITKRKLRKIIKESILRESVKMLDIVTSNHENVEETQVLRQIRGVLLVSLSDFMYKK